MVTLVAPLGLHMGDAEVPNAPDLLHDAHLIWANT